jgi:hypothetical protein
MVISSNFQTKVQSFQQSLITWSWTKRLLYWIIMSAGTASELVFLVATVWVIVNANVHPFILKVLSQAQTDNLTYLATTAFVALPVCIVGLGVVTTIGHVKMWKKAGWTSVVWSILYGLPTLTFFSLDVVTLGFSVANSSFTMPLALVVTRALAAFIFGFTAFIYHFLGKPQEQERLQEKETIIADLQKESTFNIARLQQEIREIKAEWQKETSRLNADWQHEKAQLNAEIENQNELLLESKKQQTMLLNAVNKSSDTALRGYSDEFITTLKSGIKTISVDDINRHTGHSKRKIQRAITDGLLQTAPRNNELIRVASLLEWLKQTPAKIDTEPELYVVNG